MIRISLVLAALLMLAGCSENQPLPAPEKAASQRAALSVSFASGSVVIPMDTTSQDFGTLKAFGLVDRLLRVSTPVQRIIKPAKAHQDIDCSATVTNRRTGAALGSVNYRSSPFVIAAADATPAVLAIIDAYLSANTSGVTLTQDVNPASTTSALIVSSSSENSSNASRLYSCVGFFCAYDRRCMPWRR